jgi:hypothetical protein
MMQLSIKRLSVNGVNDKLAFDALDRLNLVFMQENL